MTQLDEALQGLKEHQGVEHVLLAGADGLLVWHVGDASTLDPDRVAAMIPGIVSAGEIFGRAATAGAASTHVLELEEGVAIITPLSPELLLAVLLRSGVAFASLLRVIRSDRARLAALV